MKDKLFLGTLALLLAGCAPMNVASGIDNLRNSAMNEVGVYSSTVKDFLYSGKNEAEAMAAGQAAIQGKLKDPESARFRNVRLRPHLQGAVVCGEINAKNSYGGYVGFKRFAAGTNSGTIEDTDSRYPQITYAVNAGIDYVCRE